MRFILLLFIGLNALVSRITRRRIKLGGLRKQTVQNDDPYAAFSDYGSYDSHIDVEELPEIVDDAECKVQPVECDIPESDCVAEFLPEDDCRCQCQEEEPPKCQLDLVILVDVCSCSVEVWNGIKSYVSTIVKKLDRDIGISEELAHVSIIQYSADTKTVISFVNKEVGTNAGSLMHAIKELKMDPFVAQGSYVTNGLRNVLEEFEKAREDASKVLLTITGGYNHPSVTMGDIRGAVQILNGMGVQTHAILRSEQRLVPFDQCASIATSKAGIDVCQKRAAAMKLLNGNDEKIFRYTDAAASHDVMDAAEESCPKMEKKSIHCDCECPLPVGCPGATGLPGEEGRQGAPGAPGTCGSDGVDGAKGEKGRAGNPGIRGPNGAPGVNGPPGEPGKRGEPGYHGERGRKGERGQTGKPGVSGENGAPGATGFPGIPGLPGVTGIPGIRGATGPLGPPKVIDMAELREKVFAILDSLKPQASG